MTKFTEEKLEQAVIQLFEAQGYKHLAGEHIHKEMADVLLRDDLKQYLLNRYADEDITINEIDAIIRKLELYPASVNPFVYLNLRCPESSVTSVA